MMIIAADYPKIQFFLKSEAYKLVSKNFFLVKKRESNPSPNVKGKNKGGCYEIFK